MRRRVSIAAITIALSGCGEPAAPTDVLARSSRSSTVAISDDDSIVVMVNPEDDSISTFTTADNQRLARLPVGDEPSSVVIHPNGTTAFVANRADATVVRVDGIDGNDPSVTATVEVGSEPTGLALAPTGRTLFVAEHAEGSIGVIDVASFTRTASIDGPQNPYALAVTNDGDLEDDDELIVAPEFFGVPIEGAEAQDATRTGLIRTYNVSDLASAGGITLQPIDSGFGPDGMPTVPASPNQLGSVSIVNGKVYVTSISVSPAAPIRFDLNIQPIIYVADLEQREEDRSALGTVNVAAALRDQAPEGTQPLFMGDMVDLAFVGESGVSYSVSRAADAITRVVFGDEAPGEVSIGSAFAFQIDVTNAPEGGTTGCQTPIGIVTAHEAPRAYVNCWVNRQLGVVNLAEQRLSSTVESTSAPTAAAEIEVARGRRFFFTGRGRWANNGWSSCASCHPGGYTDNITWQFGTGPRQSTSLDGSYSHGEGPQLQRVFNWTAIFDEMHDFERNTRGTSGGVGAVTNGDCSSLATETQIMVGGNLAQPVKEQADAEDVCTEGDWDAIDAWARTIRPPRALRFLDQAAVARGAQLFGMPTDTENNGGCVACHGGPGWTVSRRFFTPSSATNMALTTTTFTPPDAWPASWNLHEFQIAAQPAAADNTGMPVPLPQVACVIRDVDTFGSDTLEIRENGTRAQGAGGYNVPSLYGLALGAPYLHHGQAATLEELLSDPAWRSHFTAANPVFLTTGDVEAQRADLIAFLLSIDQGTDLQQVPAEFDGCPTSSP
jgi:YVTN family beta-propeller protein